jgi:multicomponent Na+:H+ antiporter subunit E
VGRRILTFVFAFITWYLIAWPYDFYSGSLDIQMLIAGAVVSLMAAVILGEVFTSVRHRHNIFYRLFWGVIYIPVLFFYIIIANLDVLYRIIHPARPINPGIVKVKTGLKNTTARTVLANSITLTPGTLTVDIKDDGVLYVHCINIKHTDIKQATQHIVMRFERLLARVFE